MCIIPHTVLIEAPFSLVLGDEVYARVNAINFYGDSVTSNDGNGAIIVLVPSAPVNLQMNNALTTVSTISFTWGKGLSTGGQPIINY